MTILYTILTIIALIFVFHFIGIHINKSFGFKIGKHITIQRTFDKSLMVSTYHATSYEYDEPEKEYAKNISLTIGRFWIQFKYGHNFIIPTHYIEEGKMKNYGLYCIDDETFWRSFWWGTHLYDNPFAPSYFLGCWYMNMDNGKWVNRNDIEDYYNLKSPYIVLEEKNVTYVNKNGTEQNVPLITWHIEKRSWCPAILKRIGLSKLYQKTHIDLEFVISQNGDKQFNGIGVIYNDFKGGVYGSSIQLNNYPTVLHNMKYIHKNVYYLNVFKHNLLELIEYFMKQEKKY